MTLFDILIVLSIFGALIFAIFVKMQNNNPELVEKIRLWLDKKKEDKPKLDFTQQAYIEKRELI